MILFSTSKNSRLLEKWITARKKDTSCPGPDSWWTISPSAPSSTRCWAGTSWVPRSPSTHPSGTAHCPASCLPVLECRLARRLARRLTCILHLSHQADERLIACFHVCAASPSCHCDLLRFVAAHDSFQTSTIRSYAAAAPDSPPLAACVLLLRQNGDPCLRHTAALHRAQSRFKRTTNCFAARLALPACFLCFALRPANRLLFFPRPLDTPRRHPCADSHLFHLLQ